MLDGSYDIVPLDSGRVEMRLATTHRLSTHFNLYAGFWTDLLMRQVQENLLHIIRTRAEAGRRIAEHRIAPGTQVRRHDLDWRGLTKGGKVPTEPRRPFEPPHVMELYPRVMTWAYLEIFRTWTPEHRINVGMAMSALLGTGMKREIQREHPDWPARKVSLEVGRLSWGWKAAPPLYGPLEEEARARGESPTRGAEFLASWRLDPADEPRLSRSGKRRTLEEVNEALDRIFSARLCG